MSDGGGYPLFLSFSLNVAAGVADELTVGAVGGPGILEAVTLESSAINMVVRAYALMSRLDSRTGLANAEVIGGEPLLVTAVDEQLEGRRTGVRMLVATSRRIQMGRVVTWAPWYLVVRVENFGAAAALLTGQFAVRVFGDLVRVAPGAFEREVAVGAGYGRLGGRNPHGLVAGYRSWV